MTKKKLFVLVMGVLFFCVVAGVFKALHLEHGNKKPQETVDKAHVAEIRKALEQCKDEDKCLGGFVKFRGDTRAYRLSSCINDCDDGEESIFYLLKNYLENPLGMSDEKLDGIDIITLPYDRNWAEFAMRHARSFVVWPRK